MGWKAFVLFYTVIYLIIAAWWDWKFKKIPNWLNFPSILLGLSLNFYFGGWCGGKNSLWGFFLGLGLYIIPFALGGVGAGDVKFLAGIGALRGADFVICTFLLSSVFYFIISLFLLLKEGKLKNFFRKFYVTVSAKTNTLDTIYESDWNLPLGIFISLAALASDIFIFDLMKEVWKNVF